MTQTYNLKKCLTSPLLSFDKPTYFYHSIFTQVKGFSNVTVLFPFPPRDIQVVETLFSPWNLPLYSVCLWFSHSDRFPLYSVNNVHKYISTSLLIFPKEDVVSHVRAGEVQHFFLYHITSPRIDPVKQLELLDLISQTDAVTLCWQIKNLINLPCVKRAETGGNADRKK